MRLLCPLLTTFLPFQVLADPPRVVTDIAPIHSLVAQVMGDLGEPDVLISGAADPHDFQFTFSQAEAVQSADLVIWMGPALTPWLDDALDDLAPNAAQLTLLESEGWTKLEARDWDDGHEHDEHDEHDEHESVAHGDHDKALDPHAWLNVSTAALWSRDIANQLALIDPENAATYAANADAAIADLNALDQEIAAKLSGLSDVRFMVPHDAYQYFGDRYGVAAVGAITLSDGQAPSPAKIADLQADVRAMDVVCVLSDPQARQEWGDLVREGTSARTAVADPLGGAFAPGKDHYTQTLTALSDAYVACLSGG